MSKKHFIQLADCLKDVRSEFNSYFIGSVSDRAFDMVLDNLITFCRSQNPQFNESRFRDYIAGTCGPNGGKR